MECVSLLDRVPRSRTLEEYRGSWLILAFYPSDFSFVCPTELISFNSHIGDFQQRNCQILAVSADSIDSHNEWLSMPIADGGIGAIHFPLAADAGGIVAQDYGVWIGAKQVATRGLFIIDPAGILQYAVVHNLSVGRNPDEVLRVLDALQTGGLCPANWSAGDGKFDPEAVLKTGTVLGHYRIRKKLGSGTFGAVFAAWDIHLERMVAIKVLKRSIFESRDIVLREARTAAHLNDPHICTIYAVEQEEGLPLIAMEYIDGKPLSQLISEGSLDFELSCKIALQIAAGMAVAHGAGVVHGDLKPANIMVNKDGLAKILDFGLARVQHMQSQETLRRETPTEGILGMKFEGDFESTVDFRQSTQSYSTSLRGTLAYMSPEQAGGYIGGVASDTFSYAILVAEMLTGNRADAVYQPLEWLSKLRGGDVAGDVLVGLDECYRNLLEPMLSREPAERPGMAEITERWQRFMNSRTRSLSI
jgi:alkyl hydroperoxide reductase subunit AhpC/predicted Ser/Thr protein kinase